MTFISTTQHQAFCKAVKQELAKAGDGSTLMEQNLARFLKDMEQLHTDYLHHLQAIQFLILQYDTLKKESRMMLRKQLAIHKNHISKRHRSQGSMLKE